MFFTRNKSPWERGYQSGTSWFDPCVRKTVPCSEHRLGHLIGDLLLHQVNDTPAAMPVLTYSKFFFFTSQNMQMQIRFPFTCICKGEYVSRNLPTNKMRGEPFLSDHQNVSKCPIFMLQFYFAYREVTHCIIAHELSLFICLYGELYSCHETYCLVIQMVEYGFSVSFII